jgi:predicted transcriptional regulator
MVTLSPNACFHRLNPDISSMTQKEIVLDAINELPDEASLDEIAERVDFLAAIQKGFDQLDRGEGIPHEEVKRQLATWLTS